MPQLDNQASDLLVASSKNQGLPAAPGNDALSTVLETIRLRGAFFFLWEPSWPYATGVPNGESFSHLVTPGADQIISYHIVTQGPCWGCVADEPPVLLQTGDIFILPHGDAYVIGSEPRAPQAEDESEALEFFRLLAAGELPAVISDGGAGQQSSRLICGFLGCTMRPFNPLLNTLPKMLHLPMPSGPADPLSSLIQFALTESQQQGAGAHCMLMRLSEVMFVEVIRRYLRTAADDSSGWLGGLGDPLVGKALNVLHQHLDYPWTLERLSADIGTSRSTLAERFNALVGIPPMQYLTKWRMQVAATRLADNNSKTFSIAQEVGYESEASFSRAFKREVGLTPTQWRNRYKTH